MADLPSGPTPSQTIGPFFHVALASPPPAHLVHDDEDAVDLHGRVLDGAGDGVSDALLEVWDPATGRFGRCHTEDDGRFAFLLARPVPGGHLGVAVFARGLLAHLVTRCYFDPVDDGALAAVPAERRTTLLAVADGEGFRFDIHLQGPDETVFLAV
jgi:protocatechuate 3,4-dioxygenase alpha subunit